MATRFTPRRFRFSLASMFLLTFLGAGLFAWIRPGAPRPELSASRGFERVMGNFHWYVVRYPNGTSEEFLDMPPYGSMDSTYVRSETSKVGVYETAKSQGLWDSRTRHEGLIRPGDEVLCEARFQAVLEELKRRDVHVEQLGFFEEPRVLVLSLRWPRLEEALRAAQGDDRR